MPGGRHGPQRIGDVLGNVLARRGYAERQANEGMEAAWVEVAGNVMAAHSRPSQLRRGVLEVVVRNSSALQELSFKKKRLLDGLAKMLPTKKIKDLRFRVGEPE